MPVISRLLSTLLRIGELGFAAVVAGINGSYIHTYSKAHAWPKARFIYTEVVAGISIILALFWLLPFTASVINWPGDLILFILWIVAFALLVNVSLLPSVPTNVYGSKASDQSCTNSGLNHSIAGRSGLGVVSSITLELVRKRQLHSRSSPQYFGSSVQSWPSGLFIV